MRYSQVIEWYGITISGPVADMVDVHFTAAAVHFHILERVRSEDDRLFHLLRHRAHLFEMKRLVYSEGDFAFAVDESLRGLEQRLNWNPNLNEMLPDPMMFESFPADRSLRVGEAHPFDIYINKAAILMIERNHYGLAS